MDETDTKVPSTIVEKQLPGLGDCKPNTVYIHIVRTDDECKSTEFSEWPRGKMLWQDENGAIQDIPVPSGYLPLAGGVMTGGINFGGGTAVSSPEDLSKCLHFYDGNVELGMSVTGNTLNFVATQADDHFDFRIASTTTARIGNSGLELFGSTFLKTPVLFVAGVEISGVPAIGNVLMAESPIKAVWGVSPSSGGVTMAQVNEAIAAAITALKADSNTLYALLESSGIPGMNAVIPPDKTLEVHMGFVIRAT